MELSPRIRVIVITISLAAGSCDSGDDPETDNANVDVYVAGYEYSNSPSVPVAKYWKNGDAVNLQGSDRSRAHAVTVSGADVFVAGTREGRNLIASYWKNGERTDLSDGTSDADATDIVVVGSDVYVLGHRHRDNPNGPRFEDAIYWQNGTIHVLGGSALMSSANDMVVANGDIYVAGSFVKDNSSTRLARYWKNGVPADLTDGNEDASVCTSIFVQGDDIYISGSETENGKGIATYWRNGVPHRLTDGTRYAGANSIVVSGNDIYVAGFESNEHTTIAKYWKNGQEIILTDGLKSHYGYANSIAVVGNDVHLAGQDGPENNPWAINWKNGVKTYLTNPDVNSNASGVSIFLVPR